MEQCFSVPGEISQIVTISLRRQCHGYGCHTLNQLQLMVRIQGKAESDSVLELLLYQLDTQGLDISSPWEPSGEDCLAAALWPRLLGAWLEKERWVGCTELSVSVRADWSHAKLCIQACRKLGNMEPPIWTVAQLRGGGLQWRTRAELNRKGYGIGVAEYSALVSWLPPITVVHCSTPSMRPNTPSQTDIRDAVGQSYIPPCVVGKIISSADHGQLLLQCEPPRELLDEPISGVSDLQLADTLCQQRAVFPIQIDYHDTRMVECLAVLRRLMDPYPLPLEYVVVRWVESVDAPLSVMHMALVRDCLLGVGRENVHEACSRPQWTVSTLDFYAGCYFPGGTMRPGWTMLGGGGDGQMRLTGLAQLYSRCPRTRVQRPLCLPHPWQADPPLPRNVTIDLTTHIPQHLPSPPGWEIWQRNGRVWIADPQRSVARLDAAQYGLLWAMRGMGERDAPSQQFLQQVLENCSLQRAADNHHGVHWSRHLLASIHGIMGTDLLIGASAVTYNPHFAHFVSPFPGDSQLGAVLDWPSVPALLVLDSFDPKLRPAILEQAAAHSREVWILRQHNGTDNGDLLLLSNLKAQRVAELPRKSAVIHAPLCWEEASWDTLPSRAATQIWKLTPHTLQSQQSAQPFDADTLTRLAGGGHHRFAFHWHEHPIPTRLQLYRQNQQDAERFTWTGLVAGTDGSVDLREELMGAGGVVGTDPVPDLKFSVRVGGPLATIRAEAASLLHLLRTGCPSITVNTSAARLVKAS